MQSGSARKETPKPAHTGHQPPAFTIRPSQISTNVSATWSITTSQVNPTRLFEVLGYRTSIPFDPVELYRVQGRLEIAEQMLQLEIRGREQAVVKQNYSQLSLMSILAFVDAANNKLDQAESVCPEAAASAKSAIWRGRPSYT
jgi:hypothetical protein